MRNFKNFKLKTTLPLMAAAAACAALVSFKQLNPTTTMKTIIHRAEDRGTADHGWLKATFSFSFAGYYDPNKMGFGALRVLNDDMIAPGKGFGKHPHDNMEIVTIPTQGVVAHGDNFGNESALIKAGDIQIMSAGTGVRHSEFNHSQEETLRLFQIWVLPKEHNIKPRYDQKTFDPAQRHNKWQTVVGPDKTGDSLWINQDAWFSLADYDAGKQTEYYIKRKGNGVYLMVIDGSIKINGEILKRRDAIGVYDTDKVSIEILENTKLLAVDVPMTL